MDAFTKYISDILRYPLLNKEQEILLARQVQEWLQAENPTKRQQRVGERAYHKLVNCNLRLVVSIAKRYAPHAKRTEMIDIVQEGNMGLAHGVKKFDPERGYALSTYVYWWIRQAITRYLSCSDRVIRLPSHAVELLSKLRQWKPQFEAIHGRAPMLEECAEFCGTNPSRMRDYLDRSFDCDSLDRVVTDGDALLLDVISDGEHPMDQLEESFAGFELEEMLGHLDDVDRSIVEALYALKGGDPASYLKVAKEHGMSRERARQRCHRALTRLRVLANSKNYVR
jgi:RNA polymerase nonessential primary-like sigma factor